LALAPGWAIAAPSATAPVAPAPAASAPAPAAPAEVKPVAFTRLAVRLAVGQPWDVEQGGMFCAVTRSQVWPGGQVDFPILTLKDPFRAQFLAAGLKTEGDPNNLFETSPASADYAVAGVIVDMHQRVCRPRTTPAEVNNANGEVSMTIDWQVYSRLQKQVVATVHTVGRAELKDPTPGGVQILMVDAFSENVKQLADAADLRKVLAGAPRAETELVKPAAQPSIDLGVALGGQSVDEAVKSVVLVRSGAGEGSGVLVSKDGYILTAAHVVGDAPKVTIRWSDGAETAGQVVRVAKGRDVALIKTDDHAHAPLKLRRDEPAIGDSVFAIGALYGQKFQSSVTRGVMSADRVFDGYAFIQSDVTVDPGASGGPLLDSQGRVIGLTVMGFRPAGVPSGVNLFVPAKDAIDFLSLGLK
jgi:S1-C subfamily serine protease